MGSMRKGSLALWLIVLLVLACLAGVGFWFTRRHTLTPESTAAPVPEENPALIRNANGQALANLYQDITRQTGIEFTFHNGQEAEHYAILESLGGGIGLIDYDGDGLLDIVVTGGGYYDGPDKRTIKGWGNRLYKNLGQGRFRDVTKEVGLDQPVFYSHGCAVGDYDCDGWPDLLITGWGRMALYHNEPDGKGGRRFVEVTRQAGLPDGLWTTSAAWADFDGDGFPDLYVCQYVNWSLDNNPVCGGYTARIKRDVCPPKQFTALPHHVFRNLGNGKFQDVSKEAGLRVPRDEKDYDQLGYLSESVKDTLRTADKGKDYGKGLGVVAVDVDSDGKPDIYVANDTVDNFLYLNKSIPGHIRFEEIGMPAGVARDERGVPDGSMGTDAAAETGGLLPSLWCTNYENEMHALYRNAGNSVFLFSTPASGIAAIGQKYVGFGTGFFDIDNHGWEDLVISNGHVIRYPVQTGLQQEPVLLRNTGQGRYKAITEQGGDYFRTGHVGRGVAPGDLDNDGRIDLVISHVNEPVAVLHNEADVGNHWLGIELAGKNHRDVVGARVVIEAGGRSLTRFAKGGASYMSSGDRRHLFGIGQTEHVDRVTVFWPSGQEQRWDFSGQPSDRYWRLEEGKPAPEPPPWLTKQVASP
jgi:enediyne biosynthesis protein E4